MLTDRDKKLLRWIENYKAITIQQATVLFFNNLDVSARRRLNQLQEAGLIKSYTRKLTKEKVYYQEKKKSNHDLYIYDFIKVIKKEGYNLRKLILSPRFLDGKIIPDAYLEIRKGNEILTLLLEVDSSHYTSHSKMQMYEMLYKSGEVQEQAYGVFPSLVIARPSLNDIRYNSRNFRVVYTSLSFDNLNKLLLL